MFRNILVPVDGSRDADCAAHVAVSLANQHGSKVTLLNIIHSPYLISGDPNRSDPNIMNDAYQASLTAGETITKNTLQKLNVENVSIETEIAWGNPAEVIAAKVDESSYDLVVIGRQGSGAIKRLFQGSVSERVANLVYCPVIQVKAEETRVEATIDIGPIIGEV